MTTYLSEIFFYGTLADLELLSVVLARPVVTGELRPGRLDGYRRVAAAGELFPVCLPAPGSSTEGMVLLAASADDIRRILFYEGVDYEFARETVITSAGPMAVEMCFLTDRIDVTEDPWHLEEWRIKDKHRSLLEAEGIMRYFDILDFEALEAKWPEIKEDAERRFNQGDRAFIPR